MSKLRIVSGTLAALALATALAAPAEAREYRRGGMSPGAAAVVGAMGGLAVGALVAGATRPVYAAPTPVYVAPQPVYVEPVCVIERQREYVRGWGWQVRERTVCH